PVILSEAKDLAKLVKILRFAQDDTEGVSPTLRLLRASVPPWLDPFEQSLRRQCALALGEAGALVFGADMAGVACRTDDAHHPREVDLRLVALLAKVIALGADGLRVGHQLLDGGVAVDLWWEVAEVRQSAQVRLADV